jgi:uncharacterized membrane protein YdjX (TVP38/TMEM64 family)
VLVLLALAAAVVTLASRFHLGTQWKAAMQTALAWVDQLGVWGPIAFIALYTVASVFAFPATPLTLGGGAVFGLVRGSCYVLAGATLGATAAFLVGRYAARGWVVKRFSGNPTFAALDRAVAEEGWKIVALTRIAPIFPFALLNYGFGITGVPLGHYVAASAVCMIPGTVLYVYLGSLAQAGAQPAAPAFWVARVAGLVAVLVVILVIARKARKALARRIPESESAE